MTFFERYWPTLVAVPVMAGVGFWFWSNRSSEIVQELPSSAGEFPDSTGTEQTIEDDIPTVLGSGQSRPKLEPLAPLKPRVEYRETLQFVEGTPGEPGEELTQESAEVEGALRQVKIELYGTQDCVHCEAARDFMKANQLNFANHDVDADPMKKETARRLSGSTGVPVIVIDGKVLRGFSQGAFQASLTSAVRSRIKR